VPKLTVAAVAKYTARSKRREIPDTTPGLFLIIQPSGHKSWALRFRRPDGRPAKLTIGRAELSDTETADEPVLGGALTLSMARQLANKIDRERARNIDVIAEHNARKHRQRAEVADRAANAFGAAAREFFADHKVKKWGTRPRRWRGDARLLGLDYPRGCDPAQTEPEVIRGGLADTWAAKPVGEIDGDNIYAVVDDARRRGIPGLKRHNGGTSDARGRKMHSALSVLFRWLVQHRKVRSNPCLGVERPGAPPARERALSGAEVRWFWRACEKIGPPYGGLLQLLLLTGARLGEVTGMRRGELSEDGAAWTIPGERAKNHRPNLLPLPPLARDIIAAALRVEGEFVFSTNGARSLTGFSRAKADLDEAMLAEAKKERGKDATVPPWRIHDLRRTCATGMHALGIPPHIVEAVLNHVSGAKAGVAGVYNVAQYRPEKKAALERWAAHVAGVVSGRQANVTPMQGRGARA
jgi:integrase